MEQNVINKDGYNKIAAKYNEERHIYNNEKELEQFINFLPKNAKVLDAGCGGGSVAKFLVSKGFIVTGIDISSKMLEIARKEVPEAEFIECDMTKIAFPEDSFDGIVSLYAIFHVPKEKHKLLFRKFHEIMKHRGILFFCVGSEEWEGSDDYLGTRIFWSNFSPEKTKHLVEEENFEIIYDEILERGGEKQYWIFARKN